MSPTNAKPVNEQAAGTPRRIPLRLVHLLLWTCCVAAGIRAYQGFLPQLQPLARPLGWTYIAVMGLVAGTFVASSLAGAWHRRVRRDTFPRLAGDWLNLFGCAAAVLNGLLVVVMLAVALDERTWPQTSPSVFWSQFSVAWYTHSTTLIHQATGWGMGSMLSLGAVWYLRGRMAPAWYGVFGLFAVASCTLFAGHLLASLRLQVAASNSTIDRWLNVGFRAWSLWCGQVYIAAVVICGLAIVVAMVRERNRTDADWLHWSGVGAWLTVAVTQVATYAVLEWHG